MRSPCRFARGHALTRVSRRLGAFWGALAAAVFVASGAAAQSTPPAAGDKGDAASPPANGTTDAPPSDTQFSFARPFGWAKFPSRLDVSGYLLPQFVYVSLPSALPRNRIQYGARGTRVGFALYGMAFEDWSYMAHFVLSPGGTENLAILDPSPSPSINVALPTATGTSLSVEEASIGYRPASWFLGKVGLVRMPFSLGQTTPIPKQMFPFRPPITGEFQSGSDAGFLGTFAFFDARLQANLGAFMGTSLGLPLPGFTVRGPAFVASVAAHPLGAMSLREGDPKRGPLRVAVGTSSIYRRASAFDTTGYEATQFNDLRFAGWLRASWRGIYAQGEYLKRVSSDNLSGGRTASEGGYAQASYVQPIGSVAVGPLVRGGVLSTSIDFAPRKFTELEAALVFYPRADAEEPDKLRVTVEYLRAETSPFAEVQHEGIVQLQWEF